MKFTLLISLTFLYFTNIVGQTRIQESIAVLDFEILANKEILEEYKWMSLGFSETLSDAFSRIPNFFVVERSQINKVIKEQTLQHSGRIDTTGIVATGKLLGVKKVLLGSCQIATGRMLVNMRIVNVETGIITPLEEFPVIVKIDSVLYIQKLICIQVLRQFRVAANTSLDELNTTTVKSTKKFTAFEFLIKGIELYNKSNYSEAIQMFNTAIDYDKKYKKAFFKRAYTFLQLNKYNEAISDFKNTGSYIKKDSVYFLIGRSYFLSGDYLKAKTYYEKSLSQNPFSITSELALKELDSLTKKTESTITILTEKKTSNEQKPGKIETVYEFHYGIAKVKSVNKFGFIDTANNLVIPFIYDEVKDFKWGFAAVRIGNLWGYINDYGKEVISPKYQCAEDFTKFGVAVTKKENKYGMITKQDEIKISFLYDQIVLTSYDSIVFVRNYTKNGYICGAFDINGKLILPLIYDNYQRDRFYLLKGEFYQYLHVSKNGKWGIVNMKNEVILSFEYEDENCIREFKNGYAAVKSNERWGFVNEKGNVVIGNAYENVSDFENNVFQIKLKGKWGIINDKFIVSIPPAYDSLEHLKGGKFWAAKKDSKWGIVDEKNNITCKFEFDGIGEKVTRNTYSISSYIPNYYDKNYLFVPAIKKNKIVYINETGKCVFKCE